MYLLLYRVNRTLSYSYNQGFIYDIANDCYYDTCTWVFCISKFPDLDDAVVHSVKHRHTINGNSI